jgi:anti-sigma B factor antagonist
VLITVRDVPKKSVRVFKIYGDLGNETAIELSRGLGDLLGMNGGRVVIDLAEVRLLSSSAIGVLVQQHLNFTQRRRGQILLAAPNPYVEQVLSVANLRKVMPIHETVDGALAAFAESTIPLSRPGTALEPR